MHSAHVRLERLASSALRPIGEPRSAGSRPEDVEALVDELRAGRTDASRRHRHQRRRRGAHAHGPPARVLAAADREPLEPAFPGVRRASIVGRAKRELRRGAWRRTLAVCSTRAAALGCRLGAVPAPSPMTTCAMRASSMRRLAFAGGGARDRRDRALRPLGESRGRLLALQAPRRARATTNSRSATAGQYRARRRGAVEIRPRLWEGCRAAMGVDSPTGSVVGGFRVGELLARGAMGAVYVAEDADGRRVALKLLSPELAHDERFRQRFLRESQLAATLDHPNIVRTLASGEDGGVLYLAMDYVDGVDLRELLRREGRLEPERAVELVAAGGRGARRGARGRARPPRREARQHPRREGAKASGVRLRLRPRAARLVGRQPHRRPRLRRHGRLRRAGADPRRAGRRPGRRLRARLRPLRVPRRRAAVRARERARGRLRAPERAAAAAHRAAARAARGVGRRVARALAKEPDARYPTAARSPPPQTTRCTDARRGAALAGGCSPARPRRPRSRSRPRRPARCSRCATALRRRRRAGAERPLVLGAVDADDRTHRSRASARARVSARGTAPRTSSSRAAPRGCCCRATSGSCASTSHAQLTRRSIAVGRRSGGSPPATASSGPRRTGPELARIATATGRLERFRPGAAPSTGLTAGDGSLWLATEGDRRRGPGERQLRPPLPVRRERQDHLRRRGALVARGSRHPPEARSATRAACSPDRPARHRQRRRGRRRPCLGVGRSRRRRLRARRDATCACGASSRQASTRSGSPFADGRLWVTNVAAGTVTSLDPRTGARRRLVVGALPSGGRYADGVVWTGTVPEPPPLPRPAGPSCGSRSRARI